MDSLLVALIIGAGVIIFVYGTAKDYTTSEKLAPLKGTVEMTPWYRNKDGGFSTTKFLVISILVIISSLITGYFTGWANAGYGLIGGGILRLAASWYTGRVISDAESRILKSRVKDI